MYFEYAITANERGRDLVAHIAGRRKLFGTRALDIGCAYGGMVVALAERGCQVTGVEINESLLQLGRVNLADHGVSSPLLKRDATLPAPDFAGSFDVILANDVIEHVADLDGFLDNLESWLRPGGAAYLEIPNGKAVDAVLSDGHHSLFGITLLDFADASAYLKAARGTEYDTYNYLELDEYLERFRKRGLGAEVLDRTFESASVDRLRASLEKLHATAEASLAAVPDSIRDILRGRVTTYLNDVRACLGRIPDSEAVLRYGCGFWTVEVSSGTLRPNLGALMQTQLTPAGTTPVQNPATCANAASETPPAEHGRLCGSSNGYDRDLVLTSAVNVVQGYAALHTARFRHAPYLPGCCNVCGKPTVFFCNDQSLYRESLNCAECGTTSRYRSIARGVLRAVREITGIEADSVSALCRHRPRVQLRVYDTQVPLAVPTVGYPLPSILGRCEWIEVQCSQFKPELALGQVLAPKVTNQNLERLTFKDNSFDVVITSDVMEHVRLADRAHREIARVLRSGGVYLFTVPHFRDRRDTLVRVQAIDPDDPSRDLALMEPEYHGDGNSAEGRALAYRNYGTDLDDELVSVGLAVEYTKQDFPELGIMNTELFYCRKK